MLDERFGDGRLSDTQIDTYRYHARRMLTRGNYNLFAEITLRVLASHDALVREVERLRRAQSARRDQDMEAELVARENDALRLHIRDLDAERRRLLDELRQMNQELAALKRQQLRLPPSWTEE